MGGGGMVSFDAKFWQVIPAGMFSGQYRFRAHVRINYVAGINSTSDFRVQFDPETMHEQTVYLEELHSHLDPPSDHEFDIDTVVSLASGGHKIQFETAADCYFETGAGPAYFNVYLDNVSLKKAV